MNLLELSSKIMQFLIFNFGGTASDVELYSIRFNLFIYDNYHFFFTERTLQIMA